jgi:uncharacterized repeat protein (TIGR03803 family)
MKTTLKTIVFLIISCFLNIIVSAQTLTTLVKFNGTNGDNPWALVQGTNGNLYGLTANSIFMMTPQGSLTVLTNLEFTPGGIGVYPLNGLILGNDGNFYGTRSYYDSGTNAAGMIFEMNAEGALTVLTNFEASSTENFMFGAPAGLTQGNDGNYYGAMGYGPTSPFFGGYFFGMSPVGMFTTQVQLTNGYWPDSPPLQASDGIFFGTTTAGGDSSLFSGAGGGTIYKMTPDGNLTTLVILEETNGEVPFGGLVEGNDGNLYGTCAYGGLYTNGTIFCMTTNGEFTTMASFNGTNGYRPITTLIQASDGNFYGTATGGFGDNFPYNYGTVFKMTPDGTLTTLVTFHGTNGSSPYGSLVQASDGNLYGITGHYNYDYNVDGTVFKITGLNLLPAFQSITLTNGTVNLTWNSVSNWTYRVQYETNLTDVNWTDLPGDVLATNSISSATDIESVSQRFYRLVLLR